MAQQLRRLFPTPRIRAVLQFRQQLNQSLAQGGHDVRRVAGRQTTNDGNGLFSDFKHLVVQGNEQTPQHAGLGQIGVEFTPQRLNGRRPNRRFVVRDGDGQDTVQHFAPEPGRGA